MKLNFEFISSPDLKSGDFFLQLHELDRDYFPTPWTYDALKEFIDTHHFLIGIVKNEEILIGFTLFEKQDADSFAHLLKIVVTKNFQGKGIGANLLDESLKYLKLNGINKFFLEVEISNSSAIKIYEKAGFKIVHLNKNFYGAGRHAHIMTFEPK